MDPPEQTDALFPGFVCFFIDVIFKSFVNFCLYRFSAFQTVFLLVFFLCALGSINPVACSRKIIFFTVSVSFLHFMNFQKAVFAFRQN